ncbi:CBN-NRA-1 protein [Caenorhabditis brenneri]|uniref:Nicotinic receptor-associated protein 1 n=1 Tax=Caenorhabditis brenneri TaxID=135651 RepID=G0MRC9_CAEBE|nr:CBN-NRA-1 protein [Caenorhabditis brenneri]
MNQSTSIGIADSSRPKTNVRLTISANNLMDLDVFSKSDPICLIYEKTSGKKSTTTEEITVPTWQDKQWTERGRSEVVMNNLNPQFTKTFLLPYFFEETQLLRFEIYDADSPNVGQDLSAHDFLGRFECVLAQIVSYSTLKAHLGKKGEIGSQWRNKDKNTKTGSITIRAEEDEKNEKIQFDVCGESLDKKDFFGKSDPYLNFKRKFDDGSTHLVHRTEVKPKTLDPRWATVQINTQTLCGKDGDRPIIIECYDHDKWKKDDLIGTAQTTLNELLKGGGSTGDAVEILLTNEKKKAKKGDKYKCSGTLKIWNSKIVIEPTFLDFISGGTQLDFAVAVDFTASNGAPKNSSSLHYMSADRPNQYELALRSVLSICQHYNSSKTFEAFGFGAKLPNQSSVSAVFPLDLLRGTSQVVGISGVMSAYRHALQNVQLYGPTNFAPIIDTVASKAQNMIYDSARYQILLIITDGIISDMHATIRSIINASGLPLSIIIIGVGNEDFEKMHELDSDDTLLQQDSRIAQRDIVQFVTIREFLNNGRGMYLDPDVVQENLAREVLYEVPGQLTGYMKQRGFQPRPVETPWARDSPPPEYDPVLDGIGRRTPAPGPGFQIPIQQEMPSASAPPMY